MSTEPTVNDTLRVWCHTCSEYSVATINASNQEYECVICSSSFIERYGQHVEEFILPAHRNRNNLSTTNNQSTSNRQSTQTRATPATGSQVLQRTVNRVLAMDVQVSPSETSTLLEVAQNTARQRGIPVEIVVRQSSTPEEIEALASLLSNEQQRSVSLHPRLMRLQSSRQQRTTPSQTNTNNSRSNRQFPTTGFNSGFFDVLGSLLGNLSDESSSLERILHHILMNENSRAGVPAASEETIQNLKRYTLPEDFSRAEFDECGISLDKFCPGDVCIALPCGHKYKEEEIQKWLKLHATCPICRVEIQPHAEEVTLLA